MRCWFRHFSSMGVGRIFRFMRTYNRRFAEIARRRRKRRALGKTNRAHRCLIPGFKLHSGNPKLFLKASPNGRGSKLESCSRPKHTLLSRPKPHGFLLECAQPTGGNVGRVSMSSRRARLSEPTRSILTPEWNRFQLRKGRQLLIRAHERRYVAVIRLHPTIAARVESSLTRRPRPASSRSLAFAHRSAFRKQQRDARATTSHACRQ